MATTKRSRNTPFGAEDAPYVLVEDRKCTDCTHLKRTVLAYMSGKPVTWACPYRMHLGTGTGREGLTCAHYRMKKARQKAYAQELKQRAMAAKSERELRLEAEVDELRHKLSDALLTNIRLKKDMKNVHQAYVMASAELAKAKGTVVALRSDLSAAHAWYANGGGRGNGEGEEG